MLRLRALLARAHGDETGYRDYRDRYRAMASDLGFDRPYEVGRGNAVTAAVPISYPVSRNRRRYEGLKPLAPMFAIFGDVAERQARHQEWQQ